MEKAKAGRISLRTASIAGTWLTILSALCGCARGQPQPDGTTLTPPERSEPAAGTASTGGAGASVPPPADTNAGSRVGASSSSASTEPAAGTGSAPSATGRAPDSTSEPKTAAAPPPAVQPPYAKSASPADGTWTPFAPPNGQPPLLWRTTLHPHPVSRFVSVEVVAIDLTRLRVDWVVGAADTGKERLEPFMTPGTISSDVVSQAVAVFNGGFLARHGWWGQQSHGQTLVPAKESGCGVAVFTDGRTDLGEYGKFKDDPTLETYRQTPPCLVRDSMLHPSLESGNDRVWAGKNQERKTRRRSALGISSSSNTLFYLLGTEAGPADLGRALLALHARTGLQLDINWNWTRFFLIAEDEQGQPTVGPPLVEGMVHDYGEYLSRPSKRDFFVVLRR